MARHPDAAPAGHGALAGRHRKRRPGRTANGGAGGELAARLVPFPRGPVRPYLRASGGLLLFLRGPFLPGGDVYDFILQLGAGLEVPIGERLSLFGDLHVVHLSNGQGLGPFNPAFTGEGGLIGAAYALAAPGPPVAPAPVATVDEARPDWRPGATFDAGAGQAAGGTEWALRDRVAQKLTRHTLALMDIESGVVDSAHFVEAGLDLAGHWTFVSAGVHSGYRHAAGTGTFVESAQVEAVDQPRGIAGADGASGSPARRGGQVPRRGGRCGCFRSRRS